MQYSRSNPYHTEPLVDPAVIAGAEADWINPGGCRDQVSLSLFQSTLDILKRIQIIACNSPGWTTAVCSAAQAFCNSRIYNRLYGRWDPYYVPTAVPSPAIPDPYPPQIDTYLHNPE